MKATGSSLTRWVTGLALGLAISGAAFAATGIAATKHNLGTGGTSQISVGASGSGSDQICVFCHTPHGSDTSAAVPLWNKKLTTGPFQVYNSTAASATSSIDGEILAVGSVSIACLSCHDGTQAMDNMINRPGSGLYDANGVNLWGVGNATKMTGTPVPVIGTDLRNDHPIGIAYCGGGLTGSAGTVSGSCNDADFVGPSTITGTHFTSAVVKTKDINSRPVFWVETGTVNTTRQKTDIALYTRDFAGAANTPSVECGSCHDPHVEAKAGDTNIMFMRVTTAGSAICLSCHVK